MSRLPLALALAVLVALPLAGCGRKGAPEVPDGAVYPRAYPHTPFPAAPAPKRQDQPDADTNSQSGPTK